MRRQPRRVARRKREAVYASDQKLSDYEDEPPRFRSEAASKMTPRMGWSLVRTDHETHDGTEIAPVTKSEPHGSRNGDYRAGRRGIFLPLHVLLATHPMSCTSVRLLTRTCCSSPEAKYVTRVHGWPSPPQTDTDISYPPSPGGQGAMRVLEHDLSEDQDLEDSCTLLDQSSSTRREQGVVAAAWRAHRRRSW